MTTSRGRSSEPDAFIDRVRDLIEEAAAAVDPASACADEQRRGLARIAGTLDAVPYVTMANLANADAAMRGAVLSLVEVQLSA